MIGRKVLLVRSFKFIQRSFYRSSHSRTERTYLSPYGTPIIHLLPTLIFIICLVWTEKLSVRASLGHCVIAYRVISKHRNIICSIHRIEFRVQTYMIHCPYCERASIPTTRALGADIFNVTKVQINLASKCKIYSLLAVFVTCWTSWISAAIFTFFYFVIWRLSSALAWRYLLRSQFLSSTERIHSNLSVCEMKLTASSDGPLSDSLIKSPRQHLQ